jgi:putative SOS response-associated peptidase YedK
LWLQKKSAEMASCCSEEDGMTTRLGPAESSQFPVDLLRPFPAVEMKAWKVGQAVGNVRNNSPELLVPTG